jgi:HPt (histidine-containing phosphotransfer) domain-containing protein
LQLVDNLTLTAYDAWGNGGAQPAEDAPVPPIIDLVLLARHSLGDQNLELELLEMFERQAARLIGQLTETIPQNSKAAADLAHKLKGSALAVGANRVAQAASRLEALCNDPPGQSGLAAALASLAGSVSEAREAIVKLTA